MKTIFLTAKTEPELDALIEQYMQEFMPAGYGTSVRSKTQKDDGTWVAIITRFETCD